MNKYTFPLPRTDGRGKRLRAGDLVRIAAVPDLSGMAASSVRESRPVFAHLVGTYRRIVGFDEYGHAQLSFRIRSGRHRGYHSVWIEPFLLVKRQHRLPEASTRSRRRASLSQE
jgi:hypothetical protein